MPSNDVDRRPIKVLIVDAECVIAEMLSMALQLEGAAAMTAFDASAALAATKRFRPDLVILDPRMPDMDGMVLLKRLLASCPGMMTILLGAERACQNRASPDAPVTEWLPKPFSIEGALARVRMMLSSNGFKTQWTRSKLTVGDLAVDEATRTVSRGGVDISLTPTEFNVLRFLVRNAGHAVTTGEILGRVWRYDYLGKPAQVRLYVMYLRRRIDEGREPMIHTVYPTGYVLRAPLGSCV